MADDNRVEFISSIYKQNRDGDDELVVEQGQQGTVHGTSLQGRTAKEAVQQEKELRIKVDGTSEYKTFDTMGVLWPERAQELREQGEL